MSINVGACGACGQALGLQMHVCPGPGRSIGPDLTVQKAPVRRKRVPNLRKLLEHPDETIARAAREVTAQARLLEILAPLEPEKRRRVLLAAACLYGIEP